MRIARWAHLTKQATRNSGLISIRSVKNPLVSKATASRNGLHRSWKILADTLGMDRTDAIAIVVLTTVALIVGAITVALTIDITGDGPSHAIIAYSWSNHPAIETHGYWLPGFAYMAGLCLMVMHNPLLTPRLYNLCLSTLTIPVFYALVRKLYGSSKALLSTVALVALPLRIGLGASSLTEPSFLFFMIAALLCLTVATEGTRVRIIPLSMSVFFFDLAEMTRYEVWPLIPLVLCYLYARSRRISVTVFAAVALSFFPMVWSVGNYLYFGDFLYPFFKISHPLEDANPVDIATALAYLSDLALGHLGWLLSTAAIAGLATELYRMMRGRLSAQRAAYAILFVAVWAMVFKGALTLGAGVYDRYLLFGFTLALPLATAAYVAIFGRYRYSVAVGVLAVSVSLSVAYRENYPEVFVTRAMPTDILKLVRWLPTSPYRNDAVLLTKLNWQSTYFPLYAPYMLERYYIVSIFSDDASMRRFIEKARPTLLITWIGDGDDRARIVHVLGRPLRLKKPVFATTRYIEVYDVSRVMEDRQR